MSQHYSNPARESDPHALPDLETFRVYPWEGGQPGGLPALPDGMEPGWYWQSCSPGCLPDGEPNGPFATEDEALADAREGVDDGADDGDCIYCDGPCRGHDPLVSHTPDCDDPATCKEFGCDVCGRDVPSCAGAKVTACGIETYACDACRGVKS